MVKEYSTAPLPFMGQKRMFVGKFKNILANYPDNITIVDLFGGSGLLSHVAKREKPQSKVIYNDYDNYSRRINNIGRTNNLLCDIRAIIGQYARHKSLPKEMKANILNRIKEDEQTGFVDYITLSSSLLFSMKYCISLETLSKETMYNNIRMADYNAEGYLYGLDIVCKDYKTLAVEYDNTSNVLYLVDPPYLNTDVGTYKMSWTLSDYLDVLTILQGKSFVYFTSNKSSIIELCSWIESNKLKTNPFADSKKTEFHAHMNYNSQYTDIMLYTLKK